MSNTSRSPSPVCVDLDDVTSRDASPVTQSELEVDNPNDSSDRQGKLFEIEAPAEGIYESYQLALDDVHDFTKHKGYEVSIAKNIGKRNKSGAYYKKLIRCTRGGKLKNSRKLTDETRVRPNRGSKKTQCPMTFKLIADDPQDAGGRWKIVHSTNKGSYLHNHKAIAAIGLPGHRRRARTEQVKARIASGAASSIQASQILASIRSEQDTEQMLITRRDVDNELARLRKEMVGTQTAVEAMFNEMKKLGFHFRYSVNEDDNSLERLFLIHPKSLELLRRYPDVLLIDCTYKTNKYNLPLVNLAVVSGMNTTVQAGLAFIRSEAEDSCLWVLENWKSVIDEEKIESPRIFLTDRSIALMRAVETTFPEADFLICRWHQNKDVLAYCRRKIKSQFRDPETKEWRDHPDTVRCMELYFACINAETSEDFDKGRETVKAEFPTIAQYLEKEWWPWKEKCVSHWTNTYTHFNQRSTSRLEGLHHVLKSWLKTSRSNINVFLQKALPMWEQLFAETVFMEVSQEKLTIPYSLQNPFYDRVARIIYRYALLQVEEQRTKVRREIQEEKDNPQRKKSVCKGIFRKTMGIPCSHEIRPLLEKNQHLMPQHFDRHWWIDRESAPDDSSRRIIEPHVLRTRRVVEKPKHQKGAGVTGTRRDPLLAERVDFYPIPPPLQPLHHSDAGIPRRSRKSESSPPACCASSSTPSTPGFSTARSTPSLPGAAATLPATRSFSTTALPGAVSHPATATRYSAAEPSRASPLSTAAPFATTGSSSGPAGRRRRVFQSPQAP